MRYLLGLLALLLPLSVCHALGLPGGLSLPNPPPIGIPGLSQITSEEPWISTSLADAQTEVPFLDQYDPRVLTPLAEMPRGANGEFLLLPGAYDFWAQSYCLHAGTHGPGHGAGYLYAPLKGPGAHITTDILTHSVDHPEIPQHNIQLLLWANLSRTKFDDMSPELQQTARTLLSDGEINTLRGSALERIAPELVDNAFISMPPGVRQVLEAEANLRNMFAGQVSDYTQIEGVAVLSGDPPPAKGDREVPAGRWSYDPAGYFVAYFPEGYPSTLVQISCPGGLDVERDAAGRITRIGDGRGNSIETDYAPGDPAAISGDAGVKVSPFAAIRLTAAGGSKLELTGGYALTGLPSGKGRPALSSLTGLPARYAWSVEHRKQVDKLMSRIAKGSQTPLPAGVQGKALARLVDLGSYAQAIWEALSARAEQDDTTDLLLANPAYEAWQALVLDLGQGRVPDDLAALPPAPSHHPFGVMGFAPVGPVTAIVSALSTQYGGGGLSNFSGAGGVASPGETGRQRLAQSDRGQDDDSDKPKRNRNKSTPAYQETYANKDILKRGKEAISAFTKWTSICDIMSGGPLGWLASQALGEVGLDFQGQLRDGIIDTIFTVAGGISQGLGGDPPRSDFDQLATPQPVAVMLYEPSAKLTPERAQAANRAVGDLADLYSKLCAAQITRDRLGGALLAHDTAGINRQGEALIRLKRQSGEAMLVLADSLEALLQMVNQEEFPATSDVYTADQIRAAQAKLAAGGFSPGRQEAFSRLGLSAAQIEEIRQSALSLDPDDLPRNLPADTETLIAALRDWGNMWASLPAGAPGG